MMKIKKCSLVDEISWFDRAKSYKTDKMNDDTKWKQEKVFNDQRLIVNIPVSPSF